MKTLELKGPFRFEGKNTIFDVLDWKVNGIYLWCVEYEKNKFRVYYVGEAADIKNRNKSHYKKQLVGLYSGHCIESLKKNIKIIKHRAQEGMIERFSSENRETFNKNFLDNMRLFYAEIPREGDPKKDKQMRCRYETAIVRVIEDHGQNVLHVGHLRYWDGEKKTVKTKAEGVFIEALHGEVLKV